MSKLSAAESADHPYVETGNLKTETCLKCHPTKNQGKFVHTAVGMGCENCHVATSRENQTTITLWGKGGDLCGKCHDISRNPMLHGPYQAGQCLICHNPHTGDYPAQTRVAVNTLCSSCHIPDQPDVKFNSGTKMVTLLDGRVYGLAAWMSAPKIGERHAEGNLSRLGNAPVAVKEPGKPAAESNCLSCHEPHASAAKHLLRKAVAGGGAAEDSPVGNHISFLRVSGVPQDAPALSGAFPGGRR